MDVNSEGTVIQFIALFMSSRKITFIMKLFGITCS